MGLFNKFSSSDIYKDKEGNTLFYPWGMFGRGVVITTEIAQNQIHRFRKKSLIAAYTLIVLAAITQSYWFLVVLPFHTAWYYFECAKVTKGLTTTEEKMGYRKFAETRANSLSFKMLILIVAMFVVMLAVGILSLTNGNVTFSSLAVIAIAGLFIFHGGCMIVMKYQSKKIDLELGGHNT
jgi:hypothetical protein